MSAKDNSFSASPKLEFISAGCNRVANCIDWLLWSNNDQLNFGENQEEKKTDCEFTEEKKGHGWVVFGAQNGVCLAYVHPHETIESSKLGSHTLISIFRGHESSVSSVCWIYDEAGCPRGIMSGGLDGKVLVWTPTISEFKDHLSHPDSWFDCAWKISATLSGHEGAVTFVAAPKPFTCYNQTFDQFLVSGDIRSKLLLWRWSKVNSSCTLQPFQVISFKANYSLCGSITYVPLKDSNKIRKILAVGNTDKKVRLYTDGFDSEEDFSKFELVTTLEGHEDWVRSVSFKAFPGEDHDFLLLATASQDRSIRLWKLLPVKDSQTTPTSNANNSDILAAALEQMNFSGGKGQLSTRAHLFVLPHAGKWSVMLESILIGHDDWVYSVTWHPQLSKPSLVSASADKSLMIWSPDSSTGIWVNDSQLGEIGGNALGLYGGAFSPDGRALLALGYKGALHLWRRTEEDSGAWEAFPFLSGHIGSVTSVAWDPVYPYLVTTSLDQTARAFSFCQMVGWREIARPQIHGYDLRRVRFVSPFRYVCAADEKVIRVLDAPLPFVKRLAHLTQVTITGQSDRSQGANLPALGLSNKAVYNSLAASGDQDLNAYTESSLSEDTSLNNKAYPEHNPENTSSPQLPFEEDLLQTTLWPELDKLYGHGYELVALAVSPDSNFIASSARATVAEHASLRIFSTNNFKQFGILDGHQLTATCLAFSPDSRFLVSGSRDRSWCLYIKNDDTTEVPYRLIHIAPKAHGRILWDIQFSPDSNHFLTASRDKTVKVWEISPDASSVSCIDTLTFDYPVTALAIESRFSSFVRFSVGLENGFIGLGSGHLKSDSPDKNWKIDHWVSESNCPLSQVNELAFRPISECNQVDNDVSLLASVSVDHSLRVYRC